MMRVASAVVLVRGSGSDLEVFLVERSPKLRFLGGYHASPYAARSLLAGLEQLEEEARALRVGTDWLLEEW